jgi:SAM-dependent methyltransferase
MSESSPTLWDAEAEAFDDAADHGLRDPAVRAAWRTLLLEHLPTPPGRVADLGCGTGTLSVLLAELGFCVDALDFSPRMVEAARVKSAELAQVTVELADAFDPPLAERSYDAVLCRHVLWAMPDPGVALDRWGRLLRTGGTMVLVEGRWSTGAGLSAEETVSLVQNAGGRAELTRLRDPAYWGRTIDDDRYLLRVSWETVGPGG